MARGTGRLSPESFDRLHDFVRVQVTAGYAPLPEIMEGALAVAGDSGVALDELRTVIRVVAERADALHRAEQAGWPEVTDCDRLDAAFAELEAVGIVARQHFSCCASCGADDIREELARLEKAGRQVRGYTFFHVQDTEHAIAGESLFLSYGAPVQDSAEALAVGHEVMAVLRRHGLEPVWNGRKANRIALPMTWQRRR
jgi:hypothetical protein